MKKKLPLLLLLFILLCPVSANAMSVKGKVTSPTSINIRLKGKTKYKYWRIRKDISDPNGGPEKWKTIKTLRTSKKSFNIKKLKKGKYYNYEISFGNKKNGKFKPVKYDYVYSLYTGLSPSWWQDYAASDAKCSPSYIDLWGFNSGDGLTAKGIQIYKKVKGGKWKKLKTIKKKEFNFRDKKVTAGKTYYYKLRSYGTYRGKRIYSPWSDTMERSAINQVGKFTCKLISLDIESIELKLTSDKYNGKLVMDPNGFYYTDYDSESDDEEVNLSITKISKDGKTWENADSITLNAGESIYLKFEELNGTHDLRNAIGMNNDYVKYDTWPSYLYISFNGEGSSPHNDEFIH